MFQFLYYKPGLFQHKQKFVKFHKTVPWASKSEWHTEAEHWPPTQVMLYWLLWSCTTAILNFCNKFEAFILEYLTLLYEVVVVVVIFVINIIIIHLTSMLMARSVIL
jgi:hypothetical protein